ncbi:hypothetical protein [Taklimakanibacter deserti]|uniref:hypothetical protein n=1 Tax=Taklimakanibacter deserti TaxID=2267839 RepID=UPI0013C42533
MANASAQDVFQAAKARPQGTENRLKPWANVTGEAFWSMGKAFMLAAGGGFVIIRDLAWATHEFPHTPREWGAWMAYFRAKGIRTVTFEQKGKGTVPAQWPHLFDANWQEKFDQHSADRYMAELARETRNASGALDAAARKTFVTNKMGYDPAKRRGQFRADDEVEREPTLIDKDALMASYDKDMAELMARRAAKQK